MNCEFRFQISKSTFTITIKQFLNDFDNYAEIWHELIRRKFYVISKSESKFSSFKRTIYNKQNSSFSRWKTKNRDFFKIMTNFMNFFNITDQIQYSPTYQNQNSFKKKRKNFDRVFDAKVIIDFSFKIHFQITTKNESDFKKKKWKEKKFLNKKTTLIWSTKTKKKSIITNSAMKTSRTITKNLMQIMKTKIRFQIRSIKKIRLSNL